MATGCPSSPSFARSHIPTSCSMASFGQGGTMGIRHNGSVMSSSMIPIPNSASLSPTNDFKQLRRPSRLSQFSSLGKKEIRSSTISTFSGPKRSSVRKNTNLANLMCLRQADVREVPQSPRSRGQASTQCQNGTQGPDACVGSDGSLLLGCVLGMIRKLVSAYEIKFTLELLEDFVNKRPAMYTIGVNATDFAQDLQSFADSMLSGSTNPNTAPLDIIQSVVSQTMTPQSRSPEGLPFKLSVMSGDSCLSGDSAFSSRGNGSPTRRGNKLPTMSPALETEENDVEAESPRHGSSPESPDEHPDGFSLPNGPAKKYELQGNDQYEDDLQDEEVLQNGSEKMNGFELDEDDVLDLDDVSLEQAAFLAKRSDRFVCHPNHQARTFLDLVVLGLIIMECVALPLGLSFAIALPPEVNMISLTLFTIDMIMSFTTGFYHRDLLIMKRRRIVKNYLKTWFFLDVTSLFPWETIFNAASGGESGEGGGARTAFVRVLKLGKLLRVMRLLRLAKITALVKRLQTVGFLPADLSHLKFGVAVAKLFVVFGLLSHWAACVYGWIGDPANVGSSLEDVQPHSIASCTMGGPCEAGIEGSPWRYRYGLDNYHALIQYFVALQFTTGLITGGDTPMQTGQPIERLFSIFVMFCSVCIMSMVVGEILLIMNRRAEARMAFDELNSQAREFMTSRKVSTQVQVRVFRYLETQHKIKSGHNSSNREFMAQLSSELQNELIEQLNSSLLLMHPFFLKVQDNQAALQQLCMEASPVIFAATETIVERGAPATSAHFIVVGKVRVEVNNSKIVYLRPPSWIGDLCLFCDTLRGGTVTAVVTSETLMLPKSAMAAVCEDHPNFKEQFDIFREQIENGQRESLMCPICHEFGHTAKMCPTLGHVKKTNRRSLWKNYKRQATVKIFSHIIPSHRGSTGSNASTMVNTSTNNSLE